MKNPGGTPDAVIQKIHSIGQCCDYAVAMMADETLNCSLNHAFTEEPE